MHDADVILAQLPARIAKKIIVTEGCWLWDGWHALGYADVWWESRPQRVHRVVYSLVVAPIPDGVHAHHLCHNKGCVNPAHIEPIAAADHTRLHHPLRTHCPQGHPYEGANVHVTRKPDGRLKRTCRTCARNAARARRERERKAVGVAS